MEEAVQVLNISKCFIPNLKYYKIDRQYFQKHLCKVNVSSFLLLALFPWVALWICIHVWIQLFHVQLETQKYIIE